ncbi:hypothetical protein Agub_g616 [Astrephomene gubernaculifera]|uniref:U3 small nucleolar RNA-associated protein 6 n=1 Tax=Astrephomene gubernaculifera TaxID=47775 RepID=A0AAD3DG51_9CHLO|nr:hypothetical protein Agub_g616 [Astrephomene gubernaculifera]
MADTVQYLMEQMIPELEDLEQKGYFSRAEIKKIVQKRQNFEYLLKRRAALKEDFYRYIEFEAKLEELRQIRKQKLGIKGKKSLAEVAIVRRIHFIFERAGRKFRSDLGLWMRWIEVCKQYKSTKQLSKVITKALQRHSTVSELWIEAARWEFDQNNDISAARTLMQQGIRMCKQDEAIWVAYYRLELLYALKLRVRRKVLGLDDPAASGGAEGEGDASAAAVREVMRGGVARIVFKNAVATLPGRLAFRARFLGVLRGFEMGFVEGLVEQVYDSIRQDFSQVPEAWDLLARRHIDFPTLRKEASSQQPQQQQPPEPQPLTEEEEVAAAERQLERQERADATGPAQQDPAGPWDADAHQRVCALFEEGLAAVPGARMYQLFAGYLSGALEGLLAGGAGEAALAAGVEVAAQLFGVLQRAHSGGCSTAETYLTWVDWAEKVQQHKMALKAARKGCERFPSDVAMWRRRLQLESALATASSSSSQHPHPDQQQQAGGLLATFTAALQATQPEQAVEVWQMAVEAVPAAGGPAWGRLADMLAAACAKVAKRNPSGGLGSVAAAMVEKARLSLGADAARQLYGKLLAVPGAGGDLYRCAIRLEREELQQQQQPEAAAPAPPPKQALKRITDLYEAAVAAHGKTETDLWIDYAQWLVRCGKGAGQVYWRATKELEDPDAFIAQYRQALQQ